MGISKIKRFLTRDVGSDAETTNPNNAGSRVVRKKKRMGAKVEKKKLVVSIYGNQLRGVVTVSKAGQLDIENVFTIHEVVEDDKVVDYLSVLTLSMLKDKVAENRGVKKNIVVVMENVETLNKIVKYPPLDKKIIVDMVEDSYEKFFQSHPKDISIRGTENLGQLMEQNGEMYYLISSVNEQGVKDIALQLEGNKTPVDVVYNNILALTNVLASVNTEETVKCMLYMKGNSTQVLIMYNGVLIFHKSVDKENDSVIDNNIPVSDDEGDRVRIRYILSGVNSTLDYIRQRDNLNFTGLLLAGDLIGMEGAEGIITAETGITAANLSIKEQTTGFSLVNWSGEESIEETYLVPYGASLRGVVS